MKTIKVKKRLKIDCQKVKRAIAKFLKEEFRKRKKSLAIVGVSGGVDSALTAKLCEIAGLNVKRVFLPYGNISKSPGGDLLKIDITSIVNEQIKKIGQHLSLDKIDRGNIMARTRMIVQYALARKFNGLVVGTENLSEYYLGYFTLYGDQACDISPIAGIFKTQVMELAKHLGLTVRAPSAELWKGQTDQNELGFSYVEADPILYLYCLKKISISKIIKNFSFNSDLVYRVIEKVKNTAYKRRQIPKFFLQLKTP